MSRLNIFPMGTVYQVVQMQLSKRERKSSSPMAHDQMMPYFSCMDFQKGIPLREWDIGALEEACGRKFQAGRLQKLERAGLLGGTSLGKEDEDDTFEEGVANRGRGVVVSRAAGIDPAIMTALRVLVSSEEEWTAVGEAVGNLVTENSGGKENERLARIAAQKALDLELESKPTTLEEDEESWNKRDSLGLNSKDLLALQFRVEKKKVLKETMFALSLM